MKTEKIFTFRIPVELLDAGHALAEAEDLTLAQLMRRLLKEAVEETREKLRSKTTGTTHTAETKALLSGLKKVKRWPYPMKNVPVEVKQPLDPQ